MATKNIVPRATGEGGIGTSVKRWLGGFFNSLDVANGTNAPVNTLQRSTAYALNDVAFYSGIDAKYFLQCTTAGTTDSTVPSFTGVTSDSTVTDGTVVWTVKTLGSEENLDDYLPLTGGTLTGVVNGVTPTPGDDTTKLATTAYVQEEIRQHGNLPVGHEYFSMNPNIPQGSLPLIGGVYSRDTYADLWAWVQTQSGYLKTEAEWQTLSTANNGNVPYYSSGDGSTTFRVPSLHCWIKGSDGSAQLVGSYLQAGLPNITGLFGKIAQGFSGYNEVGGAFSWEHEGFSNIGSGTSDNSGKVYFNASQSNAIYGNANTVQPESIVGMWLVKAYGTIQDTGTINEQQYIDDRTAALRTEIAQASAVSAPIGCVQAFAGSTTPDGWLFCDGSTVSRITYADLYAVIGDTYGDGDGATTFNLPNLIDKFVQGNAVAGTEHSAGLPNIIGDGVGIQGLGVCGLAAGTSTGAFTHSQEAYYSINYTDTSVKTQNLKFDASLSNPIYGNSTTVQPPSVTMRYIIKY